MGFRTVSAALLFAAMMVLAACSAPLRRQEAARPSSVCAPFPAQGVLPPFIQEVRERMRLPFVWGIPAYSMRASADGSLVSVSDPYGRLVAWDMRVPDRPALFPGGGDPIAITRYGGIYQIGYTLRRTDAYTGSPTESGWEGISFPTNVEAGSGDPSGRYVAVTRKGGHCGEGWQVVVMDDCALQARENCSGSLPRGSCAYEPPYQWTFLTHDRSQAQVFEDVVVAMDDRSEALVLRSLTTGEKLGPWPARPTACARRRSAARGGALPAAEIMMRRHVRQPK